jgi:hypothetical protein
MFRMPVLFFALAISAPALWLSLVEHQMPLGSALGRLLIAIPAAALMLAFLRSVSSGYQTRQHTPPRDRERKDD